MKRILLALLWLLLGCSSTPAAPTTAQGDAKSSQADAKQVNNYAQGYRAHLVFHGGPADGYELTLDRDLFDAAATGTIFSFGSTHMQPPAISLAVQDDQSLVLQDPKTGKDLPKTPMSFQFQFGNLVEAVAFPAVTPKAGDYPFTCHAPLLRVYFKSTTYKSTCADLSGHVLITDWSAQKGGRFAGEFSGRLQALYPASEQDCLDRAAACTKPEVYVDVDGVFGFELPAPDGGANP